MKIFDPADTLGPDGWYKDSTLDLYREHNGSNTKGGSFYVVWYQV